MAKRLEIRMLILSVGRCPVFSCSQAPTSRPSLRPGISDIPTLYLKKSTENHGYLHEKSAHRHAPGWLLDVAGLSPAGMNEVFILS
ncbi:hypothetical protein [Pararhizobium polonicum]|uniref:hypothetical protein n=1 Tax=Pararhizobium polonicum TaxID=1612624 RepID=UPI001111D181|nr:hypothetical protein [Pararhizobium polonicum]